MITGFALLLWSIEKSMPVYADAVEWKEDIIMDSVTFPMCDGESDLTTDGCILTYNSADNCFYCTQAKDPLKECEEELASLRSYVDSLNWITIPEGWKVESVEGEWSEENK